METNDDEVVLELEGLVITARPRPSRVDRWFDTTVDVAAYPFGGQLETIFTDRDLIEFADALDALQVEGVVALGGHRAAEVRLSVAVQVGGDEGVLAVECSVTPSGDDPYPRLRFLIFDVEPFASAAAERARRLATIDPWPMPGA